MTPQEINKETKRLYKVIENARLKLLKIRDKCNHENTEETQYSFRPGNIRPATICSDCGELIKYNDTP
jgi:hypothetical protein